MSKLLQRWQMGVALGKCLSLNYQVMQHCNIEKRRMSLSCVCSKHFGRLPSSATETFSPYSQGIVSSNPDNAVAANSQEKIVQYPQGGRAYSLSPANSPTLAHHGIWQVMRAYVNLQLKVIIQEKYE